MKHERLQALQKIDLPKIVTHLKTNDTDLILSHDDYKPENVMTLPSGDLCLIDFAETSLGSPWYDLVHYLHPAKLSEKERGFVIKRYMDGMRVNDFFLDINPREVKDRLASGEVYRQLQVAHFCLTWSKVQPSLANSVGSCLDRLVESQQLDTAHIMEISAA